MGGYWAGLDGDLLFLDDLPTKDFPSTGQIWYCCVMKRNRLFVATD